MSLADEHLLEAGALLDDRFRVEQVLGRGATAVTYLARDERVGRPVVVKALRARALADWKQLELFEREARILGGLRREGIPEVVATFERGGEDAGGLELFLVLEWIEGDSLLARIELGPRLDQAELIRLADDLLGVLSYLHGRAPPVYHRDIKPSNIIVRPDGSPVLVDFGGVCDGWRAPGDAGDTIVGTVGYMPPEQYMGQVGPWSDLYALGATLLHAVTGKSPAELDFSAGRIALPGDLGIAPRLRRFVDMVLAPAPQDRPASAEEARRLLHEDPPADVAADGPARSPQLLDLGPAPRNPNGPHAELYLKLHQAHTTLPLGCLVHPLMAAGVVAIWATTESVAAIVLMFAAWSAVWTGLNAYRRRRDERLPPDGTPGGRLFIHGNHAQAEITERTEVKTDEGNHVTLAYRFSAGETLVDGTIDVTVMKGVSNPPGTRVGVLWLPDNPRLHHVVLEDDLL